MTTKQILVSNNDAFSLVEVTLALGVMGFCFLAIFGLVPTGMNSNQIAIRQTSAMNVASEIVADLKATSKTATNSPSLGIRINDGTGATPLFFKDDGTTDTQANAQFRVEVSIVSPIGRAATQGVVRLTWPAQQDDITKASGRVETFFAIDRN